MMLTPTELERLVIHTAAELARRRRARGLKLNHPEALALISDEVLEAARDGKTLAETVALGRTVLDTGDVLPGVRDLLPMVCVEGLFEDGARMITVHDPLGGGEGPNAGQRPGELLFAAGDIELNAAGRKTMIEVLNTGDRPVHVASHLHFFEANAALRFDRARAFGHRLDIPSGASVRFDPGEARLVTLTTIAGTGEVRGLNRLTEGPVGDPSVRERALERARARGFRGA